MLQLKHIMLIDDDNIFNFLNKQIIKIDNFAEKVSSHINAVNALEELKKFSESNSECFPDLIFLDINMPVMDGWQFLEEFEKLPDRCISKCKVYMLSSSIDPEDIEKSRTFKTVKDFISKPLTEETLASMAN